MLGRGCSQAAMLDFEANLSTKINTLTSQWAKRTKDGSPIEMYPWSHCLGFDTVYHLMFDEDPGSTAVGQMQYNSAWRLTFISKECFPQLETWGTSVPGPLGHMFCFVREWKLLATSIIRDIVSRTPRQPFQRFFERC